jgi:phosphate/sulfate permease
LTNRKLLIVMVALGVSAGACVGVAVRSSNPMALTWWFVAGCAGAGGCLALAARRWRRWEERNMLIAAGGWLVAATFAGTTIWPVLGAFWLYVFYFLLFTKRHDRQREASKR